MAHADGESYDSYRKDAFDNPPEGPVGVHRGQRSLGVRLLPFLIVLVVAALAGFLFWGVFSGQAARLFHGSSDAQGTAAQTSQASAAASSTDADASQSAGSDDASTATESASTDASATADDTASASESPSESASESPSDTPEESQQVNLGTDIAVVNGTLRQGYASEEASRLQGAGFEAVTPMNPNGMALPSQTVVWYENDADLATAQQVADTLGIATVEQASGMAQPITVVLME